MLALQGPGPLSGGRLAVRRCLHADGSAHMYGTIPLLRPSMTGLRGRYLLSVLRWRALDGCMRLTRRQRSRHDGACPFCPAPVRVQCQLAIVRYLSAFS